MICNEIRKLYLHRGSIFTAAHFCALALFCFSLALGSEETILNRATPAFIWILATLTHLFSSPIFLKEEFQAGLLDEIHLHALSPSFYLLAKIAAEVLLLGLPLLGITALLSPFFYLPFFQIVTLLLTLLISFPALSALGILGSLLTLRTQTGGMLIASLILPLILPLLLFSLSVMEMARLGLDSFPSFCLLTSVSILLVILSIGAGQWAFAMVVEE